MGFFSGLFGGGGSTTVVQNQRANVEVEVNPQIGIAVDLEPVADLANQINQSNVETAEQLAEALGQQGEGFRAGLEGIADQIGSLGKAAIGVGALAAAWAIVRKGA